MPCEFAFAFASIFSMLARVERDVELRSSSFTYFVGFM